MMGRLSLISTAEVCCLQFPLALYDVEFSAAMPIPKGTSFARVTMA